MATALDYKDIKEVSVNGRYLPPKKVNQVLAIWSHLFFLEKIGYSVEDRPIQLLTLGQGPLKVLMWSQMHGNESTTTKAVLDLIAFFGKGGGGDILDRCTIKIIPQLNPDGAFAYTRVNANGVDLNRDAAELTQPESIVLRETYDEWQPDYCFNLHDQRTIFNTGNSNSPATLSFLAPAADADRSITESRAESMRLISHIYMELGESLPGRIGRYDDSYNMNCVGDTFQSMGTPTLLFEAGHSPGDYSREETREFVYRAICAALQGIGKSLHKSHRVDSYNDIPENNQQFFDILISHAEILLPGARDNTRVGVMYKEVLKNNQIVFEPYLAERGKLSQYYGHIQYDCKVPSELDTLRKNKEIMQILA
ncbi:M14 family zinc carboxypeptidase [Zeaxanthinibacter enoshimensis]|uniref:Zinc carboxypeptidase n=1 Tax=Zeaxanthinibacter enoshimensis TaxID=392009 RepID=A0A4R6TLS6_9FLAO|nr:M14 family zinc carboxypeptidase [Zeaxanthinibacter enoshimensis]TDQ31482.1 zinc carboxypeptidase [Zeaxanthinibacter enoshimensis]